jgi:hypothetical protein
MEKRGEKGKTNRSQIAENRYAQARHRGSSWKTAKGVGNVSSSFFYESGVKLAVGVDLDWARRGVGRG